MSARGVLIVGSGKRVRETALPALARARELFEIHGIFARTAKTVHVDGVEHDVDALDDLTADHLAGVDLVYLAVAKDAVPDVLARLTTFDVAGIDLLIDTPVVRFKHFRHVDRLAAFQSAWVAEDCVELPWLETVRQAVAGDVLGRLRRVVFHRSAYAYHGVAMAKVLLGSNRVSRGRRRSGERVLRLANGTAARMVEPRDYASGWIVLEGTVGSVSDQPGKAPGSMLLEPLVEDGACAGFRIGDVVTRLDADEVALARAGDDGAGGTVIARMDALKRVGFLRLLRSIHAGRGAYPLAEALDDMVVDYHLEKLGLYVANPFTSSRSVLARFLLKTLTRAVT
ncbi:MAG: hypothetical protein O7B99_01265 [Planctomycetota bacterium]|nr:hypothetical protein [Planctomycetota bacterium]